MGVISFLLMAIVLTCHFCDGSVEFTEDSQYSKHMFSFHKSRPDFAMYCGYPGCKLKFKSYKTRMAHKKFHVAIVERTSETQNNDGDGGGDRLSDMDDNNSPDEHDVVDSNSEGAGLDVGVSKVDKQFLQAQFILSLRAQNVPMKIIDSIMETTESIAQCSVDDFWSKIETDLKGKNIDYSNVNLNNMKEESSSCFQSVKNKWFQDKYFIENMNVIEPKVIKLDPVVVKEVGKGGPNPRVRVKCDSYHYVSLLDSLKNLCTNENFTTLLKPLVPSTDDVFRGCYDGSCFKDNPILSNNPDALALVLYFDEVNLVDTASSRPVKYGMFYYSILNIDEEHRAGLHAIGLLMAVDCLLIDHYGINIFLKEIVKDLQVIENGLELPDGNIVYGSLFAFMGDNLASHAVGGFKRGFTAYRICRYCYAILPDIQSMCCENVTLLRTPQQYDEQVETLKSLENKKGDFQKMSREFGLNHGSLLNVLPYFHVTRNLVPDPFHDLLEGCWPMTIKKILQQLCLNDKIISLKDLNAKITSMDFGYSETRPTTISDQHLSENGNLHQTGSQMWSLANILPLILEPLVEPDNKYWLNYVCLLKITTLVFGHSISKGAVGYLPDLIEEYLTSFQDLYRCLIPKQHFLTHYPRLITCHGPLSTFSTMRMEGKHQYFVDLMTKARCFKNPSKTMAQRHQLYQAHKFSGEVGRVSSFGTIKVIDSASVPFRQLLPRNTLIQTASWFCANGVTYKPNLGYFIVGIKDFLPEFGFLVNVLINAKGEAIFAYKKVVTVRLDWYKNMYQIRPSENYCIVKFENLKIGGVYHSHSYRDQDFIVIKRSFPGLF